MGSNYGLAFSGPHKYVAIVFCFFGDSGHCFMYFCVRSAIRAQGSQGSSIRPIRDYWGLRALIRSADWEDLPRL